MKTVLLLSVLLFAASAAPVEEKLKAPDAAVQAPEEKMAAPPAHEDEAAAPEARFNFCPDDWFSHGSRCFLFVNSPKSWYSAEEHCNNLGSNLASVSSPREYIFLQGLAKTASQTIAWLGGFNLQGRWMWIDREGFYYTNWYTQASVTSNPCIYLRSTTGWSNTQCSSSQRFICAKDPFKC
ncbi:ladderlectin-like [Echeneis naucrates]|uniref:ladderlectin-like n=1 Tax=Echeneis naucrates TaxID=173247 RepID=UPI001113BCB8|nr:ladderlectin-like [Echeneis naucrates]